MLKNAIYTLGGCTPLKNKDTRANKGYFIGGYFFFENDYSILYHYIILNYDSFKWGHSLIRISNCHNKSYGYFSFFFSSTVIFCTLIPKSHINFFANMEHNINTCQLTSKL